MRPQNEAIVRLVENISISAWVIDETQTIIYMNLPMRELFGDLSGLKTAMIYESGSFEIKSISEGFSEVSIVDVPFRRISATADLGEEGKYTVEIFEDVSEQQLAHTNMAKTLARISAGTKMAKTIQNSILPIDNIYWNTIAFCSLYLPADDLGGDFYDLLKLSDDEFLIYIADVSGHGIQAALLTVFMQERIRANMETALSGTGELLKKIAQEFNSLDIDSTLYTTMAMCKYTKSRRELSISNAGHNCFPLISRHSGRTETIPTHGMPICKLADDIYYDEEIVSMNPGDRLILFTDGVVEEVDSATGRAFGAEGVRELAEAHHAYSGDYLAREIMDKSARFALINAKDDRSIVVADILS